MLMRDNLIPVPIGDKNVDMAASPIAVTPCKNGSYCGGNGTLADSCCTMDLGLFVVNGSATQRNPALSVASPTASSSKLPSSPTSPASSSAKKPARETGAIVGGAIGGVAVLVLGALIWKRLDRPKLQGHEDEISQLRATSSPSLISGPQYGENVHGPSEVSGEDGSREMDGADLILELGPSKTLHEMH